MQLSLQRLQVMGHLDAHCADEKIIAVPQQHVGRAKVLTQHIQLGRAEDQDVGDIRATHRNPGHRLAELDDPRFEQRHRQGLAGTRA